MASNIVTTSQICVHAILLLLIIWIKIARLVWLQKAQRSRQISYKSIHLFKSLRNLLPPQ
jgi:hypothetical protein